VHACPGRCCHAFAARARGYCQCWLALLLCFFITGWSPVIAQSFIELEDCGTSYIDPQDIEDNGQNRDTLFYETIFTETDQVYDYWIDVNAFGGQQVDRVEVFAILADNTLKSVASLAFGNCIDCVEGFVLMDNGEILVDQVSDINTMDLWIQSQGQPPFTLTGNLQTLTGVGRLSGQLPFCAIGMRVAYSVFSDPANASTEFSTHILCTEATQDCSFEPEATPNCLAGLILLRANLPQSCFANDATLQWYNASGLLSEEEDVNIPLAGNEGMIYLSIEDDCCQYLDSFLIENPDFAQAPPDFTACQGTSYQLNGQGGQGHYWELPNGSSNGDSTLNLPSITGSAEGLYIFHAFNAEGCEDTDSIYITVQVPPAPEIDVLEACLGDTLYLTVQNDTLFTSLEWEHPDGFPVPNGILPNFQLNDIGTYTLTAITPEGCQIINTLAVSGEALPAIDYLIDESCDSATVYLIPDTLNYSWQDGSQGSIWGTNFGGNFQVTITDAAGCQSVETIVVDEPDGPEVLFEVDQPICPGESGSIEIILHSEEREAIFSLDGGNTYTVESTFKELAPGNYSIVIQDALGCFQYFEQEIIAPDTMGVALEYEPIEVRPITDITLTATTVGDIVTYQWVPEEINSGQMTTSFTATNNLDIRIVVEDSKGCKATAGLPLTVVLGDIYIPNAITPNGDGRNDGFTFYSDGLSGEILEELRVFDRWGGLLFEAKEIPLNRESAGWDGTRRGELLNTGVYTYYGIVRFGNGLRRIFEGDVQIVR
jgi:gliding motility-associated-like protein